VISPLRINRIVNTNPSRSISCHTHKNTPKTSTYFLISCTLVLSNTSIAHRIKNGLRRTSEQLFFTIYTIYKYTEITNFFKYIYIYIMLHTCIYFFSSKICKHRNLYTHIYMQLKNHSILNSGYKTLRTRKIRSHSKKPSAEKVRFFNGLRS